MVAPVMRCSTQDHIPGSPRERVRLRAGSDRGAGTAGCVAVLIWPPTSSVDVWAPQPRWQRDFRLRFALHPNLGATLNPVVLLNELPFSRRCTQNGES